MAISPQVEAWAKDRGISRPTLEALGVASGTGDKADIAAFPYRRNGSVVAVKYRSTRDKRFWSKEGGELRFWNLDAVLASPMDRVYIAEGEMDACALVQAGVPVDQVLSVPNGAPEEASDDPDDTERYRYGFAGLEEGLNRASQFVLVTDNDGPGRALRQDLVRILGPARCWFVDWPDGAKDANAFLQSDGPEALRGLVQDGAMVWPVTGLYRLSELPEPPPLELWNLGFMEWESRLRYAPKTLSVVTGQPGHGKSLLTMQLWFNVLHRYGIRMAIASFETRPKPHHRRNLRQFYWGRPEADLTDEERAETDRWVDEHMLWITHPNRRPNLDWLLDMAEVAVVRHGARAILVDPWNKLESTRPDRQSETDYIGQALDAALDFSQDMNAHVQIVAHPAKVQGKSRKDPPTLEDISGSKNWENRCDLGLCVHRPIVFDQGQRKTEANLLVLKSRYEELGHPCQLGLKYEIGTGRYRSTDGDPSFL